MGKLVVNFGDDEGNELNFNGTVVQALLMMNGRDINDGHFGRVRHRAGGQEADQGQGHPRLSLPGDAEPALLGQGIHPDVHNIALKYGVKENDVTPAMQDIFWALLNCNEFILNH